MIRKNAVTFVRNSVIACVSSHSSWSSDPNDFVPQWYSNTLERPKRMSGRIVNFYQDSNIVSNNPCRGREEDNTSLKDFNDHHIENTFVVSAMSVELFLLLIFVNNNLFSGRDFVSSSYSTYNFFNSTLHLHISPEVIVCIVIIERFF